MVTTLGIWVLKGFQSYMLTVPGMNTDECDKGQDETLSFQDKCNYRAFAASLSPVSGVVKANNRNGEFPHTSRT